MSNFFLTWTQVYDPLNSWPLSTAVAALPVLTLFFVLVVVKARVWVSALCGLLAALLLAALVFKMPVVLVAAAAGHGFIFGMIRIAWVIVASIFLYNIACETGQFEVMKQSIAGLSSDKRLQLVLIAFCFGAFLEGTGGGGAPVAIAGSFLIGLGFKPFQAATLCLIANTAPVAWGGVGNPIRVLAEVTGLPQMQFSAMAGRILPPLSFILPFWLVRSMVGWKETFQVWPALLVSGLSFATMQFYWSNYQEAGLVDVISAVFSLLVMVVFLKFWKPAKELKIEGMAQSAVRNPQSTIQVLKAWSPFILSSVLIFIASYPKINKYLLFSELRVPMPALHNAVLKVPPVAPQPTPEAAMIDFNFIGIPGTAVFVGGLISALLLGLSLKRTLQIFGETLKEMIPSLLAISFMVGLAYVTRYGGMDTVLGLSLTGTGMLFPFFGTLLGWLGVALTGTDAGSNALFGNLQKVTAEQLGLSAILMGAANSSGGVMGKMIDAQSIVVSSSATQQTGNEAAIFKAVFKHSLALATIVGVIVMIYAYLMPWVIPR
ncbi:MAG TPA: L-lactate permease [Blastocatellia bacterium]|nr:L-lactate permease [Blastocatellia bacterium]HMV85616.1 L-lactate permease [Blastocatellia bacterium]HMZ21392.1 L-lactate permease [Blastocatellia bacterium]HNG29745.1 L-lactate permease [Blastocatellia bacterium]